MHIIKCVCIGQQILINKCYTVITCITSTCLSCPNNISAYPGRFVKFSGIISIIKVKAGFEIQSFNNCIISINRSQCSEFFILTRGIFQYHYRAVSCSTIFILWIISGIIIEPYSIFSNRG